MSAPSRAAQRWSLDSLAHPDAMTRSEYAASLGLVKATYAKAAATALVRRLRMERHDLVLMVLLESLQQLTERSHEAVAVFLKARCSLLRLSQCSESPQIRQKAQTMYDRLDAMKESLQRLHQNQLRWRLTLQAQKNQRRNRGEVVPMPVRSR